MRKAVITVTPGTSLWVGSAKKCLSIRGPVSAKIQLDKLTMEQLADKLTAFSFLRVKLVGYPDEPALHLAEFPEAHMHERIPFNLIAAFPDPPEPEPGGLISFYDPDDDTIYTVPNEPVELIDTGTPVKGKPVPTKPERK